MIEVEKEGIKDRVAVAQKGKDESRVFDTYLSSVSLLGLLAKIKV